MKFLSTLLLAAITTTGAMAQTNLLTPEAETAARELMAKALDSDLAYEIVESLTTQIGPRLAGSEAEGRARDWGSALGERLGFDRVSVEEFELPLGTWRYVYHNDSALSAGALWHRTGWLRRIPRQ